MYKTLSFLSLLAVIASGLVIIFCSWMLGLVALIISVVALGITSEKNAKQVNAAKKTGT